MHEFKPEQNPHMQPLVDNLRFIAIKFQELKAKASREERPITIVVDEYVRQLGLFGQELSENEQAMIRAMAERATHERINVDQGTLF